MCVPAGRRVPTFGREPITRPVKTVFDHCWTTFPGRQCHFRIARFATLSGWPWSFGGTMQPRRPGGGSGGGGSLGGGPLPLVAVTVTLAVAVFPVSSLATASISLLPLRSDTVVDQVPLALT